MSTYLLLVAAAVNFAMLVYWTRRCDDDRQAAHLVTYMNRVVDPVSPSLPTVESVYRAPWPVIAEEDAPIAMLASAGVSSPAPMFATLDPHVAVILIAQLQAELAKQTARIDELQKRLDESVAKGGS